MWSVRAGVGMSDRRCSVRNCGRPHNANGLCAMHGARVARTGSIEPPAPRRPNLDRRPPHNLVTAAELSDRHMGRMLKIGAVEGTLTGIIPRPNSGGVDLVLIVGGARAVFQLDAGAQVEHWRVTA